MPLHWETQGKMQICSDIIRKGSQILKFWNIPTTNSYIFKLNFHSDISLICLFKLLKFIFMQPLWQNTRAKMDKPKNLQQNDTEPLKTL